MMTSTQIAQANSIHSFDMGYGGLNPSFGREGLTGLTPFGPGMANQMGLNFLSGANTIVGAGTMAGLGAYLGSGLLGKLGLGSTGIARGLGRIATATGMGLPAALSLGALMPATLALSGMATGARQQSEVLAEMNRSFGNRNMGGRFGFGISQEGARQLTNSMRRIADTPEMLTSFKELQGVMSKLNDMQIMQGVRDASDYQRKFKGMVSALRDMSKSLNSTMEEALPFLQSSMRAGFLDAESMQRNVRLTTARSDVGTGMRRETVFREQETAGELIRRQGGSSQVGSEGMGRLIETINLARSRGIVTDEDLQQITGQIGDAGAASLGRQLFRGQNRLFNSATGRFIAAGLAERGPTGNFTGRLRADRLQQLQEGNTQDIISAGQQALSSMTDENAASFQNAVDRGLLANAGALSGPRGLEAVINAIVEEHGIRGEEQKRLLIGRLSGLNQHLVNELLQISERSAELTPGRDELIAMMRRSRLVAAFKEHGTLGGLVHHLETDLRRELISPVHRAGSNFGTRFSEYFEDVSDRYVTGDLADKFGEIVTLPAHLLGATAQGIGGSGRYTARRGESLRAAGDIIRGQSTIRREEETLRNIGQRLQQTEDHERAHVGARTSTAAVAATGLALTAGALLLAPFTGFGSLATLGTGLSLTAKASAGMYASHYGASRLGILGSDISEELQQDFNILTGNVAPQALEQTGRIVDVADKLGVGDLNLTYLRTLSLSDLIKVLNRELQVAGKSTIQVLDEIATTSEDELSRIIATKIKRLLMDKLVAGRGVDAYSDSAAAEKIRSAREVLTGIFDNAPELKSIIGSDNTDLTQVQAALRILTNPEERYNFQRSVQAGQFGPYTERLGLSEERLRTLQGEMTSFNVIDLEDVLQQQGIIDDATAQLTINAYENELVSLPNRSIAERLRSAGFNSSAVRDVVNSLTEADKRGSPFLRRLAASFDGASAPFRGATDETAIRRIASERGMGDALLDRILGDAGTELSDEERSRVANDYALQSMLASNLEYNTDFATQRSRRTTSSKMGEAQAAAMDAAEMDYIQANTTFVRAVGDVVPALRRVANSVQTQGQSRLSAVGSR